MQIVDHAQYDFFDRVHRRPNSTLLTATDHSFRQFVGIFLDTIKSGGVIRRYFKGGSDFASRAYDDDGSIVAVNRHIQTYWSKCALCNFNFDVIGKTETAAEDMRYIATKAGLHDSLPTETWLHSSSGGSTSMLAKEYFSTLTKKEVEELLKYYNFDFEAFGYGYSEYLELAKGDD